MDNLLENDTFEPVYWYVWNIMKTFGMPYIQIIDKESKKELFTKSSNPIILQNQVYHMKELYDNYDKIYWPINDADMEYLVKYSISVPIIFLIKFHAIYTYYMGNSIQQYIIIIQEKSPVFKDYTDYFGKSENNQNQFDSYI